MAKGQTARWAHRSRGLFKLDENPRTSFELKNPLESKRRSELLGCFHVRRKVVKDGVRGEEAGIDVIRVVISNVSEADLSMRVQERSVVP